MNQPITRTPINLLLAGSSQMQLQLVTGALRRRPEFNVSSCPLHGDIVLKSMKTALPDVLVLALNGQSTGWEDMALPRRLHISCAGISKILLVESVDPRVGDRCLPVWRPRIVLLRRVAHSSTLQVYSGGPPWTDLGYRAADRLPDRPCGPGALLAGRKCQWQ